MAGGSTEKLCVKIYRLSEIRKVIKDEICFTSLDYLFTVICGWSAFLEWKFKGVYQRRISLIDLFLLEDDGFYP